jgi:two-component system, chemotaxis family, chemotaxis protein CheY
MIESSSDSAGRRRSGPNTAAVGGYDLHDLDVIVVEKHISMRHMFRSVLRELGIHRVRDTGDLDTAFDMMRDTPPDLILTDWSPNLDGLTFLRRIRDVDVSPDPFVPVIVVSANTGLDHICKARDFGMTEYLAKPVSAALIYSRIRSVIDHNRRFVHTNGFFGPDRRRRDMDINGTDRRADETGSPENASDRGTIEANDAEHGSAPN